MNIYKRGAVYWLKYRTSSMAKPKRVSLRTRDGKAAQLKLQGLAPD